MSADQQPILAEPILMRWASCAIGGAIAGIVIGVWEIFVFLAVESWDSHVDLPTFIESWIKVLSIEHLEIFLNIFGGVLLGVVGGVISALFSRRMRHPITLACVWASILGSVAVVFVVISLTFGMLEKQPPAQTLFMLAMYPVTGAVYGFVLGFSARLIERRFQRMRQPRT